MREPFDPGPAVDILVEAWRDGRLLTELPEAIRPRTMMEGYDIQDRLVAVLDMPVVGWKLGMGSTIQKRQSGVGRSIAGRIFAPHVYRDGDTVPIPNAAPVTVEFEIAYVLGRDIHPDEKSYPVMDVVAEMRVAFELVLSRFVDRRAVGWPSFAADNSSFYALILGDAVDRDRIEGLAESLVVTCDGQEMARRLSGENATDPAVALTDLVAVARERSMVLPQGSIISTGTLSKPFAVTAPSAAIGARFLDRTFGFKTRVTQGPPLTRLIRTSS